MKHPERLSSGRMWRDEKTTEHHRRGVEHRRHGPSYEWDDGGKDWRFHGMLHRVGGPAYERGDYFEWWVMDKKGSS